MLIKAKTLTDYKLHSLNGEIGKIKEFYFDDHFWTIRYLIVDTENWFKDKQVLISPYALGFVDKDKQYITIELTQKQIEASPSLDSDKPVSRQFEETYHNYYGLPIYWSESYMLREIVKIEDDNKGKRKPSGVQKALDPHLRSTHDACGRNLQATDGEIGHIEDFIIDDETWAIRYVIIDTGKWWPGKKILVSPQWIEQVSWSESTVFVNLPREAINQSPEFTEESLITHELHHKVDFFGADGGT